MHADTVVPACYKVLFETTRYKKGGEMYDTQVGPYLVRRLTGMDIEEFGAQYCALIARLSDTSKVVTADVVRHIAGSIPAHQYIFGVFLNGLLVGTASMQFTRHLTGQEIRIEDVVTHSDYENQKVCTSVFRVMRRVAQELFPKTNFLVSQRLKKMTLAASPDAQGKGVYARVAGMREHEVEHDTRDVYD